MKFEYKLNDNYELVIGPPTIQDYLDLRKLSGLTPVTKSQGLPVLENSWYFIHVKDKTNNKAIAMGRIIGDGGWYFHIADIATLPSYQKQGLARFIMVNLLIEIRLKSPVPEDNYITLNADPPGVNLYKKLGFIDVNPSLGMKFKPSSDLLEYYGL